MLRLMARSMVTSIPLVAALALLAGSGMGSAAGAAAPPAGQEKAEVSEAVSGPLVGTTWRLVSFQSMDDAQGTRRPTDPSRYTLQFGADGRVRMRLDCNRAVGSWSAEPSRDPSSGGLRFGPLAATRAICSPPSLGEFVGAQSAFCLLYTSPSPRDATLSRMPSSA